MKSTKIQVRPIAYDSWIALLECIVLSEWLVQWPEWMPKLCRTDTLSVSAHVCLSKEAVSYHSLI